MQVQGRSGGETILLVEADDALRTAYAQLLEQEGYRVLQATDGFGALILVSTHRGPLDLLLTDFLLPRMSGFELFRKFSKLRPAAQAVFMSAAVDHARRVIGRDPGAPRLLPKPFETRALLEAVRESLDRRTDSAA